MCLVAAVVCVCAVAFCSSVAHHSVHWPFCVLWCFPFSIFLSRCLIDYLLNASAVVESMLHFLALPATSIS